MRQSHERRNRDTKRAAARCNLLLPLDSEHPLQLSNGLPYLLYSVIFTPGTSRCSARTGDVSTLPVLHRPFLGVAQPTTAEDWFLKAEEQGKKE